MSVQGHGCLLVGRHERGGGGLALHTDVVWIYRSPLPESQKIAGLACFFNERVDLHVDGALLPRPKTPFS